MIHHVLSVASRGFDWLDIVNPSQDELKEIAQKYGLHEMSIQDSLDPQHLPKFESFGKTHFLILRILDESATPKSDTVHKLTRKIAIFWGEKIILSIHRKDIQFLAEFRDQFSKEGAAAQPQQNISQDLILYTILKKSVESYRPLTEESALNLQKLEEQSFKTVRFESVTTGSYLLKRRLQVTKRMLKMTLESLATMGPKELMPLPFYHDLRESTERLFIESDSLIENIHSLLSLHLALDSRKTNETVRVLTVLSVVFMPLHLIVGYFGMNFNNLPFVQHAYGHYIVFVMMLIVAWGIWEVFRAKGWLKKP